MSALRDELERTGSAVVASGEGLRVTPPSAAALGRAVAVLRARRLPVQVRGNGDAPVAPGPGTALIELTGLDRISAVDSGTGVACVEAGCSVAALEAAVRRVGATLGPLLPSVRAGSVGAWLGGPTRGDRGVPGSRRETAALSVSVALADGRIAESRAAPRSATGPDLDHLALGGGGRLCVIASAWVRLFPAAPPLAFVWRTPSIMEAAAAVAQLCLDRLAPARGFARAEAGSSWLALSWEGPESARVLRDRAAAALAEREWPLVATEAMPAVRTSPDPQGVEVDASWAALGALARTASEMAFYGMHAGGAFASFAQPGGAPEACAVAARAAGARVLAPRRLRADGEPWGGAGAWGRLVEALGVAEGA
jgi:FAD/FMN-containing dehydrogenase